MVEATLSDPRGWTAHKDFEFEHVAADAEPDTRIQLTSLGTAAERCGEKIETETSCHTTITGESTTIINEARWVRGATPLKAIWAIIASTSSTMSWVMPLAMRPTSRVAAGQASADHDAADLGP